MHNILVVEDDTQLTHSIQQLLPKSEYRVFTAANLEEGYTFLATHRPSLVMLDRRLPDGDGVEIAEYLHHSLSTSPILILSEKCSIPDRIFGLQKGADDYLAKPFSSVELLLRVQKLLARTKNLDSGPLRAGQLSLFPRAGLVHVGQRTVQLRKREFELLAFLVRHKNCVINREMIIDNIWGEADTPSFTTIDVYMRRIRILLGSHNTIIQTIRGFGYIVKELTLHELT